MIMKRTILVTFSSLCAASILMSGGYGTWEKSIVFSGNVKVVPNEVLNQATNPVSAFNLNYQAETSSELNLGVSNTRSQSDISSNSGTTSVLSTNSTLGSKKTLNTSNQSTSGTSSIQAREESAK